MQIDLLGRVRNLQLPLSRPLLPLFEAVINSIHAVWEANRSDGKIEIFASRDTSQSSISEATREPFEAFEVRDNGIGFTNENFLSFETSDSTFKAARGAKGIGRLFWLKAFDAVRVESTFEDPTGGGFLRRSFTFSLAGKGISDRDFGSSSDSAPITSVLLRGFGKSYQERCPRRLDALGTKIIEHCLIFFLAESCPLITLQDGTDFIDLNETFRKQVLATARERSLTIKAERFNITSLRLYSSDERNHSVHLCANSREVEEHNLAAAIPDLGKRLNDAEGRGFVVAAYVAGDLLDQSVNAERTHFDLPTRGDLFPDEVGISDLVDGAAAEVREYVAPYLERVSEDKLARIKDYVQTKAPEYRPLLRHKGDYLSAVPPGLSDEKLDIELHRVKAKVEQDLRSTASRILATKIDDVRAMPDYIAKYRRFVEEFNEFGKATLAQYIVHRRLVLELLRKNLGVDEGGKYALEESIHGIVFPLRSTSDEIDYERQNLWIIDEKLSYHRYLASDKRLDSAEDAEIEGAERPDLLIFNAPFAFVEGTAPFGSVVVIEFKRPVRKDYADADNPIAQVLAYIRKIKKGTVLDKGGRPITLNTMTPFYAYVICDLTQSLREQAENADLIFTPDGLGFFGYNKPLATHIEVISYEKLVGDSEKRNRILFEKLQLTPSP
jgi:hypothetical protein